MYCIFYFHLVLLTSPTCGLMSISNIVSLQSAVPFVSISCLISQFGRKWRWIKSWKCDFESLESVWCPILGWRWRWRISWSQRCYNCSHTHLCYKENFLSDSSITYICSLAFGTEPSIAFSSINSADALARKELFLCCILDNSANLPRPKDVKELKEDVLKKEGITRSTQPRCHKRKRISAMWKFPWLAMMHWWDLNYMNTNETWLIKGTWFTVVCSTSSRICNHSHCWKNRAVFHCRLSWLKLMCLPHSHATAKKPIPLLHY